MDPLSGKMPFCSLKPGMKCRVAEVNTCDGSCQRLLDLGLVPGAEFEVIREAPFGDPIEIRLQGASIALRKHEGDQLTVEELPG